MIGLCTFTPIQIEYSPLIPSSTLLLLKNCQPVNPSLLVHHMDIFVLFLQMILFMSEEQSQHWFGYILQLLKNEWNCKPISSHPTFFSELLIKYQTTDNQVIRATLYEIMQLILSYSISPSSLSSLLSEFTSECSNSNEILQLLNSLYDLPCSPPELLLDEKSWIEFHGDNQNGVRLPNQDDWCFTMRFRCLCIYLVFFFIL